MSNILVVSLFLSLFYWGNGVVYSKQSSYANQNVGNVMVDNSIVNGNCYYKNGVLHDQATGYSRPLTSSELAELQDFEHRMSYWQEAVQAISQRFASRMSNMFNNPPGSNLGMDPWPMMPKVPCYCTSCSRSFVSSMVQQGPGMMSQGFYSSQSSYSPPVVSYRSYGPYTTYRSYGPYTTYRTSGPYGSSVRTYGPGMVGGISDSMDALDASMDSKI